MSKIKVAAIDYDGCLSHQSFQEALLKEPGADIAETLIEHNPDLMERLEGFNQIMVGSNRQDVRGDVQESMKSNFKTGGIDHTGSCFSILAAISQKLNCEFDPFLLGDLYTGKPHGYTVQEAMKLQEGHAHKYSNDMTANKVADISSWVFDHQKVSIVYAQIQELALRHPNDEIEYHFIDDRDDILKNIEAFFKANPELIPGNVTIKTVRYYNSNPDKHSAESSMEQVEREAIQSNDKTRKANPFYAENLRAWASKNRDSTGEQLNQEMDIKEIYSDLKTGHDAIFELHEDLRAVITLTKTSSKSANEFIRSELSQYSREAYKEQLVNVFKESWDKQYHASKLTIGYSAVLRGISKELANHPELLAQVKEDLKTHFKQDKTYGTYHVGSTSFRDEEFERDWNKFTGAKATIFQRAAKTIMQAFKRPKEEEVELPKVDQEMHL